MNEKPLITIVVPVYKVPYELLYKCLDSICAQTSKNFEAILIDDGSPDDCGKICDEYAAKNPFMRVIHQKNGGLSVVRNNGIDNAAGDWVCFVDGDDWIEPNTVEFAEAYVRECGDGDVLIWDEYYDIEGTVKKNCFLGENIEGTLCFEGAECEKLIDRILPPQITKPSPLAIVDIGTANARAYRKAFLQENHVYNQPGLKRTQYNVFNLWAFHKAEKMSKKTYEAQPYNLTFADTYSWILFTKKKYQNAKIILDNFVSEQETWSETIKEHYQKILEALNQ